MDIGCHKDPLTNSDWIEAPAALSGDNFDEGFPSYLSVDIKDGLNKGVFFFIDGSTSFGNSLSQCLNLFIVVQIAKRFLITRDYGETGDREHFVQNDSPFLVLCCNFLMLIRSTLLQKLVQDKRFFPRLFLFFAVKQTENNQVIVVIVIAA